MLQISSTLYEKFGIFDHTNWSYRRNKLWIKKIKQVNIINNNLKKVKLYYNYLQNLNKIDSLSLVDEIFVLLSSSYFVNF